MRSGDSTTRFSNRVADYSRCRPAYPDALLTVLQREIGLSHASIIADIGSGTGISSELLLRSGGTVFAVEPNAEMRRAAEARLGNEPRFRSVAARAEATTLADRSVDAVTAGQAFHWFALREARAEFIRILRPGGMAALFWNTRRTEGSPFLSAYERLLRQFGTDYLQVDHRNVSAPDLRAFFGDGYEARVFPNVQVFDFDGLRGRLLSSSYAPGPQHPDHARMLAALRQLFDAHHEHGFVRMEYDTELFFGPFA
jgi:ubiquinone/menaquinone biosynthesis C-methylase UbiE